MRTPSSTPSPAALTVCSRHGLWVHVLEPVPGALQQLKFPPTDRMNVVANPDGVRCILLALLPFERCPLIPEFLKETLR